MNELLKYLLARSFTVTLFVTTGYLVGYLHATDMPENAAPGFMLGFTAAGGVVVVVLLADKYDVFERLGVEYKDGDL